ncbi:MAG TPA: hypothetical protein VLV54_05470 [Thermoanaerobaculia bacterium]|nr:hypothetical protein [Thermoanaerobaculia bacterium]
MPIRRPFLLLFQAALLCSAVLLLALDVPVLAQRTSERACPADRPHHGSFPIEDE